LNEKKILLQQLHAIADDWSENSGLSNDYSEGEKYQTIVEKLKRLGVNASIELDTNNRSRYHVVVY